MPSRMNWLSLLSHRVIEQTMAWLSRNNEGTSFCGMSGDSGAGNGQGPGIVQMNSIVRSGRATKVKCSMAETEDTVYLPLT